MTTLTPDLLRKMHAWWRAANYLSVGQIYLHANPLLEEPLTLAHIKPRLLGHWGTTPGLNLLYVHLNRLIREHDLDMINVIGPGQKSLANEIAYSGISSAHSAKRCIEETCTMSG